MDDGQHRLAVAIVALALFAFAFDVVRTGGSMESCVLIVVLPALLALAVTFGTSPASAGGILLKTLAIATLLSAFALAAPRISAVVGLGALATVLVIVSRRRRERDTPARLYVAAGCDACAQTGAWIAARNPRGLELVPAETAPWPLRRMTYVAADGHRADGVAAFGRALERASLGWAFLGTWLRLPGVRPLVQLIVDGSGGGPRDLDTPEGPACRLPDPEAAPRQGKRPVTWSTVLFAWLPLGLLGLDLALFAACAADTGAFSGVSPLDGALYLLLFSLPFELALLVLIWMVAGLAWLLLAVLRALAARAGLAHSRRAGCPHQA